MIIFVLETAFEKHIQACMDNKIDVLQNERFDPNEFAYSYKNKQHLTQTKNLMHIAFESSNFDIVKLVHSRGAKLSLSDKFGSKCIHFAAGSKIDSFEKVCLLFVKL